MTPQNPYMVSLAGAGQEEQSKSRCLKTDSLLAHRLCNPLNRLKWEKWMVVNRIDMASPDPECCVSFRYCAPVSCLQGTQNEYCKCKLGQKWLAE